MKCRSCNLEIKNNFLDLGYQPPSNSYLSHSDLYKSEITYPLRLRVCTSCWLVQTEDYVTKTDFFNSDYAYFSSTSKTWLKHSEEYFNMITKKLSLNSESFVIEIASNDGYLLKNFVKNKIPCLGIEPTKSTADYSEKIGVPVLRDFFGYQLSLDLKRKNKHADLIIGNNVYAHVPDINDFTLGISNLLKKEGVVTLEFPHLMKMVDLNQFDTIYHEHFSYLSLHTVKYIFEKNGLKLFDVEELNTHGGSLRVYGSLIDSSYLLNKNVTRLLDLERNNGMQNINYYMNFQEKVINAKNSLLQFLLDSKNKGKIVIGYGAAAKGNTLLNYAGIKSDLIKFVCDASKSKQEKFLPGSHIPIFSIDYLETENFDYVIIFPWNIADEVLVQNKFLNNKGVRFVKAIPEITYL
jgi:hypothetical protein